MLQIPRSLATQIRSILRRLGLRTSTNRDPAVHFTADATCLRIRAMAPDVVIQYRQTGDYAPCNFGVPLSALAEADGHGSQPITFEPAGKNEVRMQWQQGPIPKQRTVASPELRDSYPDLPDDLARQPAEFRRALAEAMATTDADSTRYALGCVQLSGAKQRIAATDGRQLIVHRGFEFPWQEDVLLPASRLFLGSDLPENDPLSTGLSGEWIVIGSGPWTFGFRQPQGTRFPQIDPMLREPSRARTTLSLDPLDADFLRRSLDVLPSENDTNHPVTVDLNGHIAVRAAPGAGERPTEVVLTNSRFQGDAIRTSFNRHFLARAIKMGFGEVSFVDGEGPIFCDDGRRQYLWMAFERGSDVLPSDEAVRIESPASGAGDKSPAGNSATKKETPVNRVRRHLREAVVASGESQVASPAAVRSKDTSRSQRPSRQATSPSRLNLWLKCPLAFRLRYIDGEEPPISAAQFIGRRVHAALEHFYRYRQLGVRVDRQELVRTIRADWQAAVDREQVTFTNTAEELAYRQQTEDLVLCYWNQVPADEPRPLAIETALEAPLVDPFTGEDLGLPLVGILDLVLDDATGPLIVDFKTASRGGEPAEILHEVQLSCYAYLYRNTSDCLESSLEIRNLIKTKTPRIETHRFAARTESSFRRLFAVIRAYLDDLDAGRFIYRPGLGCAMCSYRDTHCRSWAG